MSPQAAGRLGRLVTLFVGAGLLASLVAAPAVAAPPSRADASKVVARGTVVARDAAKRAVGQERPQVSRPMMPGPERAGGAGPDRAPGEAGSMEPPPSLVPASDLRSVGAFPGIAESEDVYREPPDPWIAASPTHLVQSTNNRIRITNRLGTELVSMPAWALFGLVPSELDADPRIVWDDVHDRWVGVLLSFQDDYSDNYLNLAISEGTDPTGAWSVYSFGYEDTSGGPTLPDYPGISASSDKIVLTANEYAPDGIGGFDYVGASILVVRWSDLLAGADPVITLWTWAEDNSDLFTIRPAINVGSAGVVHLVAMNDSYQVMYARLSGTAPAEPAWQNVSSDTGLNGFCDTQAPRQPGDPPTIVDAVDGRPTDAVWRANRLAFVSTCAVTPDNGTTYDDYVRVTVLDTTAAAAVRGSDDWLGEPGADTFMGGIGYSLDGTLFVSYSRSSPTDHVSTYATAMQAGGTWTGAILVDDGEHTYTGTRWGDYVGVATDPAGTAAVWQSNEVADSSGMWQTKVSRLVLDYAAPTVTVAPNQGLVAGTTVGKYLLPVKISWTVTDSGSGVARSWLSTDQFSTGMADARAVAGSTVTRSHWWKPSTVSGLDYSYQYGVEGEDGYGNVGTFVAGSRLTAIVYQQTSATYSSGWGSSSSSLYLGGSVKYSSTAGKYATFKTSGRAFGFVSTKASTRGKVKVYVDGVYKGTVTLTASTSKYRNLAYVANFSTTGTHTIKLVVASGRVDVDAFVVIR